MGSFLSAGFSVPYGILSFVTARYYYFGGMGVWGLVFGVTLSVALLLHLAGMYGMWRNYGSRLAAATFAFGLAAVSLFLLANVFWGLFEDCSLYPYTCRAPAATDLFLFVTLILVGVMFILEGAAYIVAGRGGGTAIAAGVLFIVGGSFITSFVIAPFAGFFLLEPALIVGGIFLLMAPVPSVAAMEGRPPEYLAGPRPAAPPP